MRMRNHCVFYVDNMAAAQFRVTLRELHLATQTPRDTIAWLRANGLLANGMVCSCGAAMEECQYTRAIGGSCWRCPLRNGQKMVNLRKGSFWERYKTHFKTFLYFINQFYYNMCCLPVFPLIVAPGLY